MISVKMTALLMFLSVVALFSETGLDGKERDENWPSRFLVDGKIPKNVAVAEIDETLSSVIGANKGKNLTQLTDGLNLLRELHARMTAAKADQSYLMKLDYFLVRQFTLVLERKGDVDRQEMVNRFINLETWYFNNSGLAKKLVAGFDKGLALMRSKLSQYALEIYRSKKLEISSQQLHEGYSNLLSNSTTQVRGQAGQCGNQNFARSDCYECASWAIEKALRNGFSQSDPWHNQDVNKRLNSPQYANQFHRGWIEEKDRNVFRLTQIFSAVNNTAAEKSNGIKFALEAPKGSVLIWNICGSHPAGHIAIKTSASEAASSFRAPIQQTCGNPNAQIVGIYAPVDNSIKIDATKQKKPENLATQDSQQASGSDTASNSTAGESPLFNGINF